jgi:hypothetical protein
MYASLRSAFQRSHQPSEVQQGLNLNSCDKLKYCLKNTATKPDFNKEPESWKPQIEWDSLRP